MTEKISELFTKMLLKFDKGELDNLKANAANLNCSPGALIRSALRASGLFEPETPYLVIHVQLDKGDTKYLAKVMDDMALIPPFGMDREPYPVQQRLLAEALRRCIRRCEMEIDDRENDPD